MKHAIRLVLVTLALVVGLSLWSYVARAAAVLNVNGQKFVLMSGEEFVQAIREKDAEIERLKAERKKGCDLI